MLCLSLFLSLAFIHLVEETFGTDLTSSRHKHMLVKIDLETPEGFIALKDMNLDLASEDLLEGAYVIVTGVELEEIVQRGFSYEVLIEDLSKLQIDPEYRDYEETVAFLDSLHLEYPDLTHLEQIGASQEYGIPIWAIKISDSAALEEDEPEILFDGIHHARELLGNEICLGIADTLLEGYGVDPQITVWVDAEEIWIIPILNTEGFKYVIDSDGPVWRKNMRDNNENDIFDADYDGVDPNRNYAFNWELGGSENPSDESYRGPYPFSESETQARRDFSTLVHRFIFSISYHSFGEDVRYPWSWAGHEPPDLDVINEVAEEVATRIPLREGGGHYSYSIHDGTTGYSGNWMYGVGACIELAIETCNEFIPPGTAIDSIVHANLPGAFYLLERALAGPGITGHVTDSESGDPLEAVVTILDRDTDVIEPRTCDPGFGRYTRMLPPGEYEVYYSMEGYAGQLVQITVVPDTLTVLDVELSPDLALSIAQAEVDDDQTGQSDGNGDGLINPGETVELTLQVRNDGLSPVHDVMLELSSDDSLLTIIEGTASYGDIQPGQVLQGDSAFVFRVSQNAQYGHILTFRAIASDSASNEWLFPLEFTVYGTNIDYLSHAVDDSAGGDGDRIPEPGETVDLYIALGNTGSLMAYEVWAELRSDDPHASILEDSSFFGDIEVGDFAKGDPPYVLAFDPETPDTHTAVLALSIHATDYHEEEHFLLHLGSLGVDDLEKGALLPRIAKLYQNYPNPFNPSTTIEFEIPGDKADGRNVRLEIYDLRGRLIRTLVDETKESGRHKAHWNGEHDDGRRVGSGVYFYRILAGDFEETKKLLIIR